MTSEQKQGSIDLTPRQWAVLRLLLQGKRVPTIAAELDVSRSTVRNHLASVFRKCGVKSQPELIEFFRNRMPLEVEIDGQTFIEAHP